jgi:hypothetical protein
MAALQKVDFSTSKRAVPLYRDPIWKSKHVMKMGQHRNKNVDKKIQKSLHFFLLTFLQN